MGSMHKTGSVTSGIKAVADQRIGLGGFLMAVSRISLRA
jgi:hypothetical protein